ncbi:translation initiation factor IF-2-like [Zalophus californianus]|uniref:Translation initiation factor IF-2-like n=1 Tax=Zalophus californianus TaxID=9704 RepID=A0A6J2DXZ3_ZALCA|nr:translation initiation factor IF-2-like [Zalophus californianus]
MKPLSAEPREERRTPSRAGSLAIRSRAALGSNRCRLRPDPRGLGPRRLRVRHQLGAEVSAGCVAGPWERVGTRPLSAIEEVTHGDKETPGNGLGEVRAPPGLGESGPPEVGFPALRGLCPRIGTVTIWLAHSVPREAGTSGGPGLGVRSPPRSAPSGTQSGGPARGGLAPASQFEKSRSGTHLSSIAPAEPPTSLPLGRGAGLRRGLGALHCRAAGRAVHARGGGTRRGHIGGWDFGGRDAAQGLWQPHRGAPGAPHQNALSEGERSERSRRTSPSGAAAQRGPQCIRPVGGPRGTLAPSSCEKKSGNWIWHFRVPRQLTRPFPPSTSPFE